MAKNCRGKKNCSGKGAPRRVTSGPGRASGRDKDELDGITDTGGRGERGKGASYDTGYAGNVVGPRSKPVKTGRPK